MSVPFNSVVSYITTGDLHSLQTNLDLRLINPDEHDETGQTLLMIAAQFGQLAIVKELIRQGADINLEDIDNWTALLNAAKEGYTDIVAELITHGADIEHRDMGGWTALMWACYKGQTETARLLLEQGASANVHDLNHMSCLIWAAGRGHEEIVSDLLSYGAKVNSGDKYGTTPLVWACRRGSTEIVERLLEVGANADTAGMFSWTPLNVATKGEFTDIVNLLLEHKPNVNAADADGYTALAIACKEGYTEIAVSLLNSGAYVNMQDRSGDTNLIHAAKAGNFPIVDILLKKYADVDVQGTDRKTALYWAVEKGNVDIVKVMINANASLEVATKDGDTPLMKATRNRNIEIVQMLVEKKAKVSATDKKGDTALHIAMRARSKGIVEILLRNPKNSQLLYRPNKNGETPYNIDSSHQKSILAQIFGARRLNTNEDSENMLGYDLYSSALADILSEPSLSMPISVGLYARWGSGKSFLLGKLEEDMRSFTLQWLEPSFEFSWVLFFLIASCSLLLGYVIAVTTHMWFIGITVGIGIFILTYIISSIIRYGSKHHDWNWAYNFCVRMEKLLTSLKTILQVIFCHPPITRKDVSTSPVRFIFTNQTKVSSSGGGDASIAVILISLYSAIENEFGFFTTRLYRVFRPKSVSSSTWTFRRLCCIPNFLIFLFTIFCMFAALALFLELEFSDKKMSQHDMIESVIISLVVIVGIVFLTNLYTWVKIAVSIFLTHQRRIYKYLVHIDSAASGSYMEALKSEIEVMSSMIHCLDAFLHRQTRLVLIVDGLDSCEQDKVLRVLDAVYILFSDTGTPFVTILALDPHIIIKAIESNIHRVFHNTTVRGYDYLRNIVHLPFYLQNSGLRKVRAAQQAAVGIKRMGSHWGEEKEVEKPVNRRVSNSSMSIPDSFRKPRKGNQKLKTSESVASSMSNLHRGVTGAQDLTKVLLTDDYFSDINPRSMRRLMNIVYVTGRLLKAFNIDFNWYHLASWINITEQWPYRTSWITLYYETHESEIDDSVSLKAIFEKIKSRIPNSKELEPLFDVDHDERKLEVFLSFHSSTLLVSDLKIFLPFTINLDPYIRRAIQEQQQTAELLKSDKMGYFQSMPPSLPPSSMGAQNLMSQWPPSALAVRASDVLYSARPPTPVPVPEQFPPFSPVWWSVGSPNATMPVAAVAPRVKFKNDTSFGKLSSLSVEEVARLLSNLEGIDKSQITNYQRKLLDHNIHGRVLLTCNIGELKDTLHMSFGDWEVFRLAILSLREQEFQVMKESMDETQSYARERIPSLTASLSGEHREPQPAKPKDKPPDITEKTTEKSHSGARRQSSNASTLEKQVTMEESLIVGALETLSEEAMEDTLEETKGPPAIHHSQVLSPILSDPEEQSMEDHPQTKLIADSIIDSFAHPSNEVDVMYLKSARGSPGNRFSYSPLSASVPDIEWALSGPTPTVIYPTDAPSLDVYYGLPSTSGISAPPSIASSPSGPPPVPFGSAPARNVENLPPYSTMPMPIPKPHHRYFLLSDPQKGELEKGQSRSLSSQASSERSSYIEHWKGSVIPDNLELTENRFGKPVTITESSDQGTIEDEHSPLVPLSQQESSRPPIRMPRPTLFTSASFPSKTDNQERSSKERELQHYNSEIGVLRRFPFERQFSMDEKSDLDDGISISRHDSDIRIKTDESKPAPGMVLASPLSSRQSSRDVPVHKTYSVKSLTDYVSQDLSDVNSDESTHNSGFLSTDSSTSTVMSVLGTDKSNKPTVLTSESVESPQSDSSRSFVTTVPKDPIGSQKTLYDELVLSSKGSNTSFATPGAGSPKVTFKSSQPDSKKLLSSTETVL